MEGRRASEPPRIRCVWASTSGPWVLPHACVESGSARKQVGLGIPCWHRFWSSTYLGDAEASPVAVTLEQGFNSSVDWASQVYLRADILSEPLLHQIRLGFWELLGG